MERQTMRLALTICSLLVGISAISCSDNKEAPVDPPTQDDGTDAVVAVAVSNPLLDQLAAARQTPAKASIGPNQHYLLSGEINFHTANGDIKLASELWLAGPERMRFQLGEVGNYNTFSLYDPKNCWLKAGPREVVDYDAAELLTETALRWEILRFPWGWDNQLLLLNTAADSEPVGLDLVLERTTALGKLTLHLDSLGLPKFAALGGSAVDLSDWGSFDGQDKLVPKTWLWKYQAGKRTETIAEYLDGALFQDRAFLPVVKGSSEVGKVTSALGDERTLGDEFGVLTTSFRFLEEGQGVAQQAKLPEGEWWQADEQRFFILRHPDSELTKEWTSSDTVSKEWLRWSTYSKISRESGIASLESVMSQTGYHATGPCWAVVVPDDNRAHRSIFLMPVEKDE
jgi:hypothetical protein